MHDGALSGRAARLGLGLTAAGYEPTQAKEQRTSLPGPGRAWEKLCPGPGRDGSSFLNPDSKYPPMTT
jgi:hypothetical protein